MNRKVLILLLVLIATGVIWWKKHKSTETPAAVAKPPEEGGIKITHDTHGNVVMHVPDEIQGNVGITVAKPEAAEFSPEIKAYGRVSDPALLLAAFGEMQAQQIAADYSRQEFERMKMLKAQNNASERAFQGAEQAYVRDQALLKLSVAKVRPVWGEKITEKLLKAIKAGGEDSKQEMFFASLAEAKSLLVRVDLPGGEAVDPNNIKGARLVPLDANDSAIEGQYFGVAPNVDPLTQGRGLFFLISENTTHLFPGAAVTAFVQLSGAPVQGVIVPSQAVVRAEGSAWVYVMGADRDAFTRAEILLDRPVKQGWFISTNLTTTNYLVVAGAQSLLSQETKPAGGPD